MMFSKLEDLFYDMTVTILGDGFNKDSIRLTYLLDGQPGFRAEDDVVFIKLFEKDDAYTKQRDITYEYDPTKDTVLKIVSRTRVWETLFAVYGPNSHTVVNKIKDGVFLQKVKSKLKNKDVFLVPTMPPAVRAPEIIGGEWYDRWDLSLLWNELYYPEPEDVGYIKEVPLTVSTEAKNIFMNISK